MNDPRVGEIFGMSRGVPASETAREGIVPTPNDEKIFAYEDALATSADGEAPPAVRGLGTLEQTFLAIAQEVGYGTTSPQDAAERWFAEAETALGS